MTSVTSRARIEATTRKNVGRRLPVSTDGRITAVSSMMSPTG